jgi:ammonium transporter, Amt family
MNHLNMKKIEMKSWLMSIIFVVCLLAIPMIAMASDPTGASTGGASDVTAATAGEPTLQELANEVGHTKVALNFVWVLVAGFLVMFMQAGFALAETGFTQAKNAAHTMGMNFMVYALGMFGFWVCGFALMMGGVGAIANLGGTAPLVGETAEYTINIAGHAIGLFGTNGFFLSGGTYDVAVFGLFLFAMVFMDTAATIPTGTLAERWKWASFVLFALFMSMFVYPVFGNWVWGGGWLAQLGNQFGLGNGHVDYAGSSVVHLVGGVAALAGGIVVGPRIGKYTEDGKVNVIPGHNLPFAILGVFILAFGWFGFNAGSSLAATDLRITVVAVNTMLAAATGAIAAMIVSLIKYDKADINLMANGMLAGLVAITAPCAFVTSVGAAAIGAIAGVLLVGSLYFIDNKLKIDDPVGAISVHGVCGAWGVIALGLFADGTYGAGYNGVSTAVTGLFYGGGFGQLFAELIGTATCIVFVFTSFFIFFKVVGVLIGNRVSAEVEVNGLDMHEVGALAYPDFYQPGKLIVKTSSPTESESSSIGTEPIMET